MHSITECLERINALTQQNLDILKALNDSFFTKKEHLVVNVDENQFVIPSFMSLENKVNALQEAMDNLVNAPASGEAYFNYDGNSKTIQVRGFNNTPNAITLSKDNTGKFYVEENSIFKDFITPNAHLKFDLTTLPDDINTVIVKKVVPISSTAKELLQSYLATDEETGLTDPSAQVAYKDLFKQLSILRKSVDYEEYDTIRLLPVRKSIGTGTYVITKVLKDEILPDLTEQLTIEISTDTPLTYKRFDETIDVDLAPGQYLTTYNDRVKLQVVNVNSRSHQLVLNVVNGDYLDLVSYDKEFESLDSVPEMSKLRFFAVNDYSKDKYIDVTLEEDQYIGIFVAPLNDRMNVQAPWGSGVIINSFVIKYAEDETKSYHDFYESTIRNVGDILKEIVSITNSSITKYSQEQFNDFTGFRPVIDLNNLDVVQINRHLNDSPTVQRIRSLYSQKKQYEIDLDEVENKIASTNAMLASVSFDDTTDLRTIYEAQLNDSTKKKNELVSAINSTIKEISLAVNESDVPIENAKYHIRGYFNWDYSEDNTATGPLKTYGDHVKGIKVEYRYKNKDQVTGTAESFQDGQFIYSDWNRMEGFDRMLVPDCSDTNTYSFDYPANNDKANEPSFNQIDIPISQGESVDIRLKIVWDFGYPYIETTSDWSEVVNVEFPEKYLKDVQILDIIEENNNDIETNRFTNILIDEGITEHVNDKQQDQDITYFHKPEHIASGFYTEERRIIPLKDKLSTLDTAITNLEDTVYGSSSENIKVEFIFDSTSTQILPYQDNTVNVNVSTLDSSPSTDVKITDYTNIASVKITNTSSRSVRLFSIFPGNRGVSVNEDGSYVYDSKGNYTLPLIYNSKFADVNGYDSEDGILPSTDYRYMKQVRNQFIYLRSKDAYDGSNISAFATDDSSICTALLNSGIGQICIDSDNKRDYKTINPGESINLPIIFSFVYKNNGQYYNFTDNSNLKDLELSLDLRLSLYTDPQNYFVKIHQIKPDDADLHDKIVESQKNLTKYNSVIAKIYQPGLKQVEIK